MSNASWVTVTWEPLLNRMTDMTENFTFPQLRPYPKETIYLISFQPINDKLTPNLDLYEEAIPIIKSTDNGTFFCGVTLLHVCLLCETKST